MESGVGGFGDMSLSIESCIASNVSFPWDGDDDNASTLGTAATTGLNASLDDDGAALLWREMCETLLSSAWTPAHDPRQHARQMLNYLLMGVAGMTVCCFGLIGNLLSAIVLTRKTMKTSTYCYLAALAVCDFLVVACTMILLIKVRQRSPPFCYLPSSTRRFNQSINQLDHCYMVARRTMDHFSIYLRPPSF